MNPLQSSKNRLLVICSLLAPGFVFSQQHPNILLIISDDLRPELGCYGHPEVITPNIDSLAKKGVLFENAYCQAALSGPSRASLLSGLRPSTNGYIHNATRFRTLMPELETMPEYFGRHGYTTIRIGKIFHDDDRKQMLDCFNTKAALPDFGRPADADYKDPENKRRLNEHRRQKIAKYGPTGIGGMALGPVCEFYDEQDDKYHDGYITRSAIETLKKLNREQSPFLLCIGYKKPHLSFIAPKKYWDLYEGKNIPLPDNCRPPLNAPTFTLHDSFEVRTRMDVDKYGPFDPDFQRYLMRGYLACVSFVDQQIGRLMEALRQEGLEENTIIVFLGDHGWHLGEMGIWGKATNYEIATRVPMIIVDPHTGASGARSREIVELLDLFPTLADLAGLEAPHSLEGYSLRRILEKPEKSHDRIAVSQFPCPALREWAGVKTSDNVRQEYFDFALKEIETRIRIENPDTPLNIFQEHVIGYSVRNERYRAIIWIDQRKIPFRIIARELYDEKSDGSERVNIAREPRSQKILRRLESRMWNQIGYQSKFRL